MAVSAEGLWQMMAGICCRVEAKFLLRNAEDSVRKLMMAPPALSGRPTADILNRPVPKTDTRNVIRAGSAGIKFQLEAKKKQKVKIS